MVLVRAPATQRPPSACGGSRAPLRRAAGGGGARARGRGDLLGAGPRAAVAIARGWSSASSRVVHCAAAISFDLPLDEAREVNTAGASACSSWRRDRGRRILRRLCTSRPPTSAGASGRFDETDLDLGQGFRNTYEQSKFEGEQVLRRPPRPAVASRARASSSATARPAGRRRSTSSTGRCGRSHGA